MNHAVSVLKSEIDDTLRYLYTEAVLNSYQFNNPPKKEIIFDILHRRRALFKAVNMVCLEKGIML